MSRFRQVIPKVVFTLALCLGCAEMSSSQDLSWWRTPAQRAQIAKPKVNPADVNQASVDELMQVPGMTRVWAARIVKFRPYSNKYSLKLEGVLPSEVYERLKPYLVAHKEK